jgi:hypothetical protein
VAFLAKTLQLLGDLSHLLPAVLWQALDMLTNRILRDELLERHRNLLIEHLRNLSGISCVRRYNRVIVVRFDSFREDTRAPVIVMPPTLSGLLFDGP